MLAAASLTEAFTQIGKDFEAEHPGHSVAFSFGSSATLATQIVQGAPADVFAAASPATMKLVSDAGAADAPTNFASNTLQIAVPKNNPHKITGLHDFADKNARIAICAPQVPCGAAAIKVFALAKISPQPDTLEQDVKATLQKVASDEVDAALVYQTDVIAAEEPGRRYRVPGGAAGYQYLSDRRPQGLEELSGSHRRLWTTSCRPKPRPALAKAGFAKP